MTPYNHVGMRSLSRSGHTGRQWQLPELSALSGKKMLLKKLTILVPATFRGPPCGSLGPQETTKQCYTRKNTQQSLKKKMVSVGQWHPVGVGAPGMLLLLYGRVLALASNIT